MRQASSQQNLAESMMAPDYVQNSGLLGSLAMMAQAYAGKKMAGRAAKDDAAAREAYYKGQSGADAEAARKEAEAKAQQQAAERAQREQDAQTFGLTPDERKSYVLTGNIPQGAKDRIQGFMTNQGLAALNLDTGQYRIAQPEGAMPANVNIDPALANNPEAMAAIRQDMAAGAPAGDQSYRVPQGGGMGGGPLLPYKDPQEAARQAAADARAAEQLRLAQNADKRAQMDAEQKAAAARAAQQSKSNVLDQWMAARQGLEKGLANTETGPIAGRIPAFTTEQQIAEGAVSATAPILKQIFRSAGEGTFTDKDQELLLRMVPTRTDTPEARAAKIANIDNIIRAKVGQPMGGQTSAPSGGGWGIREIK